MSYAHTFSHAGLSTWNALSLKTCRSHYANFRKRIKIKSKCKYLTCDQKLWYEPSLVYLTRTKQKWITENQKKTVEQSWVRKRQPDGWKWIYGGKYFWKRWSLSLEWKTVWVMDGDSGDGWKDELTWVGWEEYEGEWLVWGWPIEAGSWFQRQCDVYWIERFVLEVMEDEVGRMMVTMDEEERVQREAEQRLTYVAQNSLFNSR